MINGWKEYTGSEPEFDQGQDYTKAIFYFKKKEEIRDKFGISSGKVRDKFGKTGQQIIELIQKNSSVTIPEMAESIGVSSRTVEKHIAKLREAGIIERIGSRKEGQWKVNQ